MQLDRRSKKVISSLMKLTCLSKGRGYHFPPCHILELCGFRILLECPLDLSALAAFAPIPTSSSSLIHSKPLYKTVSTLHLWNPSLIDAVLISTPAGILGLPFLSRSPGFNATVYATEPTARLGRLLMEELLSLHAGFVQFYGGDDQREGSPEWIRWEEVEKLPPAVRAIVAGEDGDEVGSWMPLYSAVDVKECMMRVRTVKYGEEACFNGALILKAFSSGLEVGSCNWTINGLRRELTYLTSAIFQSGHAMGFDYRPLQGNDMVLFSDFSALDCDRGKCSVEEDLDVAKGKDHVSCITSDVRPMCNEEIDNSLTGSDESLEETDKITFICSCVVDSLKAGGSVLIPIGRLGIVFQLLEQISQSLEYSNLKVPIYMISSVAEEILTFSSTLPEWLCRERQQKLFSGEALFGHVELMKDKRLHLFSVLQSCSLLMAWREPCIVFSPHYSLRFGPAVNLLHRWRADSRCLLILEPGIDPELALLPFKPLTIKVLQCSFLSGTKLQNVEPLLKLLRAKLVLCPQDFKPHCSARTNSIAPILYYRENVMLHVPCLREQFEACLDTDLAVQLKPRKLMPENVAVARLKGLLRLRNGTYHLVLSKKPASLLNQQLLHWGSVDPVRLLVALQERGIKGSIHRDEDAANSNVFSIRVKDPAEAMVETSAIRTVICAADESMKTLIYEALCSICDGI